MSNGPSLDQRPLLHVSSLLVLRLRLTPQLRIRVLASQQKDVLGAKAVAHSIDTTTIRNRIGKLILSVTEDGVQKRKDLLWCMPSEPHINHERLGGLCSTEFDGFNPGGVLVWGGKLGIGVRSWVASELVRHYDEEAFGGVLVGLELVVGRVDAGAAGEEEKELGG